MLAGKSSNRLTDSDFDKQQDKQVPGYLLETSDSPLQCVPTKSRIPDPRIKCKTLASLSLWGLPEPGIDAKIKRNLLFQHVGVALHMEREQPYAACPVSLYTVPPGSSH